MTEGATSRERFDAAENLEGLLSVDDVGQLLQISRSGIYRLIRRGELDTVKIGGRTRFEPSEIRAFIAARRQGDARATWSRREEAA